MNRENENHYYNELVRQARQADIADYLLRTGEKLKRVGRWYTLEEHDSVRIQGNKWYRNSQDKGGNAIDFLVEFYGMTAKQAIERLTATAISPFRKSADEVNKKTKSETGAFDDIFNVAEFDINTLDLHTNQRRVIAYLTQNRGI